MPYNSGHRSAMASAYALVVRQRKMEQINIKILAAVGPSKGSRTIVDFDEFLSVHSPSLWSSFSCSKQFPPFHILNEELRSGGRDQGMSGGCLWKPYELTRERYEVMKEEILTNPKYGARYDEDLEQMESLRKWCGAVLSKHNPRKINTA